MKTKTPKKSGNKSVRSRSPIITVNQNSTKTDGVSISGKSGENNTDRTHWRSKPEYQNQPPIQDQESFKDDVWKNRPEKEVRTRANYYKELGNECVADKNWRDAIKMYSNAIGLYPLDPIFYANRALCYLKLQQYSDAQNDCDKALRHDSKYVKAYLRRATAFQNQGKYDLAEKDFQTVISYEPNNCFAKDGLASVRKQKSSQHTSTIPSEKRMKSSLNVSNDEKPLLSKGHNFTKVMTSEKKKLEKSAGESTVIRTWTSEEKDSRVLKDSILRPAHLQSTKPLIPIKIEKVHCDYESPLKTTGTSLPLSKLIQASISKSDFNLPVQQTVLPAKTLEIEGAAPRFNQTSKKTQKVEDPNIIPPKIQENTKEFQTPHKVEIKAAEVTNAQNLENFDIPRIPISYIGFTNAWVSMKEEPVKRYLYLKKIGGEKLPAIFGDSLENSILSEIICVLRSEFISRNDLVSSFLLGLTSVRRFRTLILFLSEADKTVLRELIDYCQSRKECSDSSICKFREIFEV